MVAPSSMTGPPVCAGVSCTYRSLTSDGDTITACASAGTATARSYSMVTRTRSPIGSTLSTVPICTPSMRTLLPSYSPTAVGNQAVRCLRPGSFSVHHRPPATSSASTQATLSQRATFIPKRVSVISRCTRLR
jgi:hypothetical protein